MTWESAAQIVPVADDSWVKAQRGRFPEGVDARMSKCRVTEILANLLPSVAHCLLTYIRLQ